MLKKHRVDFDPIDKTYRTVNNYLQRLPKKGELLYLRGLFFIDSEGYLRTSIDGLLQNDPRWLR